MVAALGYMVMKKGWELIREGEDYGKTERDARPARGLLEVLTQ